MKFLVTILLLFVQAVPVQAKPPKRIPIPAPVEAVIDKFFGDNEEEGRTLHGQERSPHIEGITPDYETYVPTPPSAAEMSEAWKKLNSSQELDSLKAITFSSPPKLFLYDHSFILSTTALDPVPGAKNAWEALGSQEEKFEGICGANRGVFLEKQKSNPWEKLRKDERDSSASYYGPPNFSALDFPQRMPFGLQIIWLDGRQTQELNNLMTGSTGLPGYLCDPIAMLNKRSSAWPDAYLLGSYYGDNALEYLLP